MKDTQRMCFSKDSSFFNMSANFCILFPEGLSLGFDSNISTVQQVSLLLLHACWQRHRISSLETKHFISHNTASSLSCLALQEGNTELGKLASHQTISKLLFLSEGGLHPSGMSCKHSHEKWPGCEETMTLHSWHMQQKMQECKTPVHDCAFHDCPSLSDCLTSFSSLS